ncbi:class I SAM-dependent methyltransferase [Alsobacter sp. SYSU M60028]|uniref:Class I SAM-dependent methyltransferase n=1 Tax=Alsobacter ponti TaxID=2962936 RepID=A0ABT1LF47_9HYPH|nr:class I SAM-dependent methyltransferase [Alsobacter ponti]MCP8940109.1 class I SAM-dependent methyltransferase [Alsobacter ponti]
MADHCPVCSATTAIPFVARADVPILLNRLYPTREEARRAPTGPMDLVGCRSCGFVWNRAFDPDLIVYDQSYENDQTYSPAFMAHVRARADDVVSAIPAGDTIHVLEVGCGQGVFIGEVARAAGRRLGSATGFDPAWRGADGEGPAGSRIFRCYFDKSVADRLPTAPNVVASRHTIEHVPDPVGFLASIRDALGPASRARIFIETPCVEWIVQNQAMQDFFYEHCSLFSAEALALALKRAGFAAPSIRYVFGGQYLWAEAVASEDEAAHAPETGTLPHLDLQSFSESFIQRWRRDIREAAAQGPVALWGAGAKGVTFGLMVDEKAQYIDHVVDINPGKQNRYLPCSGLLVLGPEDAARRGARTIFIMNPGYVDEIREIAARVGITARLVPIH